MKRPAGIVAFDLDGTLLPHTTVCLHLGPWVGHHEIEELERLYDLGEMTNIEVAERDATFYKNRRRHDVWRHLEQLELINGVEEAITWLKTRSLVPVVATVTMSIAADFLCDRYGFAAGSGCELSETEDGLLLGTVARHFSADDKAAFVGQIAEQQGLGFEDVVAIVDSTSDLPLFQAAGLAIALNASSNAREAADIQLDTADLRDVIPPIERYFSARP
ncbi:MAG TPA: HAD-IB family phosphatase [Actinomycetota bacterium]|nr:HAD-IB family phosphatase [Actinomycetota bacterium]